MHHTFATPQSAANIYLRAQLLTALFISTPTQPFLCTSLIIETFSYLRRLQGTTCRTHKRKLCAYKMCGTLVKRTMIRSMF